MNQFADLAGWAQGNVETALFYLLAILAIPLAFGVVFDRIIIRSGFLLIGLFGVVSGIFLLLKAQFLALAQIMIYAVGITLVVVIALMLTNPRMETDVRRSVPAQRVPGVIVSILLFLTIYLAVRSEIWEISGKAMQPDNVQWIGISLMTYYSLPFEFASLLLLAALIGAVMLAKAERKGDAEGIDGDTLATSEERSNDVVKV